MGTDSGRVLSESGEEEERVVVGLGLGENLGESEDSGGGERGGVGRGEHVATEGDEVADCEVGLGGFVKRGGIAAVHHGEGEGEMRAIWSVAWTQRACIL